MSLLNEVANMWGSFFFFSRIDFLRSWGNYLFTMLMKTCSVLSRNLFATSSFQLQPFKRNYSHGVKVHIFTICLKLNKKPQEQTNKMLIKWGKKEFPEIVAVF